LDLQLPDSLFQCVDPDLLKGRAVFERPQPLQKTPETEFVTDGQEVLNVRILISITSPLTAKWTSSGSTRGLSAKRS
jgi:hypothetical protein